MERLTKGWVGYLRNTARQQDAQRSSEQTFNHTFTCQCGLQVPNDADLFRKHVEEDGEKHESLKTNDAIDEAFKTLTSKSMKTGYVRVLLHLYTSPSSLLHFFLSYAWMARN